MTTRTTRGFTLLEVMVAVAMLALSLTAMAAINANSFAASNYARGVTVATFLARSKMLDIELELQEDGFGSDEQTFDGDFSDEGFPGVTWQAVARPVEVDVTPLVESFLGGEVSAESLPNQMQAFLGALNGRSADAASGGSLADTNLQEEVEGGDLAQLLGGGQLELIFKQVSETLGNSIREITLEITWGEGYDEETIKFTQYLTTNGRLSGPRGGSAIPSLPGAGTRANPNTMVPPNLPGGAPNPAANQPFVPRN
jgi:general secretion pathway protein I